jgi:NAD(P)H-hydrate epimerase
MQPPPAWPERNAAHLLVSSEQMAALEQQLFASGLPVEALMEKAALAITQRIQQQWGSYLARHGAVVLVGPGHNGGDGLVIARELHLAGIQVAIWSPFERYKPLTERHLRHGLWLGIPRLHEPPEPSGEALWIDAVFGIGQSRAPGAAIETLLVQRQAQRPHTLVAVDGPTGLCSNTGRLLGTTAACAHTTYAIGLLKTGLVQDPALAWVGQVERMELGLPAPLLEQLPLEQPLGLEPGDLATVPPLALNPAAGKYGRGRVLLLAGSDRYRGAAALSLLGADASGCGSLRAALPEAMASELWRWLPHAVLQRTLASDGAGNLSLAGLADADLERLDALLLGPGIGCPQGGPSPEETAAWQRLQAFPGLLVLDADGLNRTNAAWLQRRRGPTWITPHAGEFTRLFPALTERPPLEAAAQAACQSGAAVLLKGSHTVIAAPDGRRWQVMRSAPAAARTGLGDVLAGFAAGRGAMVLASGDRADACWLAAAALAHANAGLTLQQQGRVPSPELIARLLHCEDNRPREAATLSDKSCP